MSNIVTWQYELRYLAHIPAFPRNSVYAKGPSFRLTTTIRLMRLLFEYIVLVCDALKIHAFSCVIKGGGSGLSFFKTRF